MIVNSPAGGETAADNSETEWTILDSDDCIVFTVASNHANIVVSLSICTGANRTETEIIVIPLFRWVIRETK